MDVSDRVLSGDGYSGRRPGQLDPRTGISTISLDDDDNFLRPGPGSTHDTRAAEGGEVEVEVTTGGQTSRLFTGHIDHIDWEGTEQEAMSNVVCADAWSYIANRELTLPPRGRERTGVRFRAIMAAAGITNVRADDGYVTCAETTEPVTDTIKNLVLRTVNTEISRAAVRVGRDAQGEWDFYAYIDPHKVDPPDLKVTDDPVAGTDDITLSTQPAVNEELKLLFNTAEMALPDGEVVSVSLGQAQIDAYGGEEKRRIPVWLDRADAERNGLRHLGVYGIPLRVAGPVQVRADALDAGPSAKAMGARVADRMRLAYRQIQGGTVSPYDAQHIITGVGWHLEPLGDGRFSVVRMAYDSLPVRDITRWTLGLSRLGAAGMGPDRAVPWPGGAGIEDEPVRPRNWAAAGPGRNVYALDFNRLLRLRVVARYASQADMERLEPSPRLPGQAALVTTDRRNILYAWNPGLGIFREVAST